MKLPKKIMYLTNPEAKQSFCASGDGTPETVKTQKETLVHACFGWGTKLVDQEHNILYTDNTIPTSGFCVDNFTSVSSTGTKYVTIRSPLGFIISVSVANFLNFVKKVTIINGAIQEKCCIGFHGTWTLIPEDKVAQFITPQKQTKLKLKRGDCVNLAYTPNCVYLGKRQVDKIKHSGTKSGEYHVFVSVGYSILYVSMFKSIPTCTKADDVYGYPSISDINQKIEDFCNERIKSVYVGDRAQHVVCTFANSSYYLGHDKIKIH